MKGLPPAFFMDKKLIYVKQEVLPEDLLRGLMTEFHQAKATSATVQRGYQSEERSQSRQTLCVDIKTHYDAVFSSIQAHQETLSSFFSVPLHHLQELQFLKYEAGHFFKAHTDTLNYLPQGVSQRQISVVLYLNDALSEENYHGGEFILYPTSQQRSKLQGFPLAIQANSLLAFHSNTLHEVRKVTQGVRYAIVGWFT